MCYPSPVMLRVPQHHPGHKRRGRRSCAISERPTPSPFALSSCFPVLSLTIPAHPRHSPVSPIIPAHTQDRGGVGECLCYLYGNVSKICRRADNFVQSREKEPISQNQPHPSHVADCFPEPSRWGHALTASGKPAPSLHIP